jgi:hypothetical protein
MLILDGGNSRRVGHSASSGGGVLGRIVLVVVQFVIRIADYEAYGRRALLYEGSESIWTRKRRIQAEQRRRGRSEELEHAQRSQDCHSVEVAVELRPRRVTGGIGRITARNPAT